MSLKSPPLGWDPSVNPDRSLILNLVRCLEFLFSTGADRLLGESCSVTKFFRVHADRQKSILNWKRAMHGRRYPKVDWSVMGPTAHTRDVPKLLQPLCATTPEIHATDRASSKSFEFLSTF